VKTLALEHGLPVLQPTKVRTPEFLDSLRALAPDVIVVAAYGRILPRPVLDLPPRGCINVHASILPRHRGAAPIQHAILAGDAETGVTIMAMSEEMDAGDMLLVRRTPIAPDDTGGSLTERLSQIGAAALTDALEGIAAGTIVPTPQPAEGITFAPRIEREHTRLDWTRPAVELARAVRAFAPSRRRTRRSTARRSRCWRRRCAPAPARPARCSKRARAGSSSRRAPTRWRSWRCRAGQTSHAGRRVPRRAPSRRGDVLGT
jgi:methionyl-tRNA formyltransferase